VTGDLVTAESLLREVGPVSGLGRLVTKVDPEGTDSPAAAAATLEFVLDGLWLTRRLSKAEIGDRIVYGSA
jgi:magnesium chelatase subunit I